MAVVLTLPADIMNRRMTESYVVPDASMKYQQDILHDDVNNCAYMLMDIQIGLANEYDVDSHNGYIMGVYTKGWKVYIPLYNKVVLIKNNARSNWMIQEAEFPY